MADEEQTQGPNTEAMLSQLQQEIRQGMGYLNQEIQQTKAIAEAAGQPQQQAPQQTISDLDRANQTLRDEFLTNPVGYEHQRQAIFDKKLEDRLSQIRNEDKTRHDSQQAYDGFWGGFYEEYPNLRSYHSTILEIYNNQPAHVTDPNQRAYNAALTIQQDMEGQLRSRLEQEARKDSQGQDLGTGSSSQNDLMSMFNPSLAQGEVMHDQEQATIDNVAKMRAQKADMQRGFVQKAPSPGKPGPTGSV